MDQKAFSDAVAALAGEHGITILRYLASGEWRIASDVSRALEIHTTTASKFLARMHELGVLERRLRRSHTRTTFEYRFPTRRLTLELEFDNAPEPFQDAIDFYLEYVSRVLTKARRFGWPGIEEQMEKRLRTGHGGLKEHLYSRILDEGRVRRMDGLKSLFSEIHREFLAIASGAMGHSTARRILAGAAEEATKGHERIVDRYGLRRSLEV